MITITNGTQTLTVTKGAYTSMYAPQGWEILQSSKIVAKKDDFSSVSENKEIIPPESNSTKSDQKYNPEEEIKDELEEDEVSLSEIPLSEMSVPQLKLYAKQLGVKVNTDSARQLRNQIRKALEG